jgi:peptidoglycan/LPS O-acetylase OafA/YrhL
MEQKKPPFRLEIEGLRGLALMLILCYHFFVRFLELFAPDVMSPLAPLFVVYWDRLGVTVFLLISGFFILPESFTNQKSYLFKRIFRLWPAYFMAICACFIITHIWAYPRTIGWTAFLLNIPFINGFIGVPYVDGAHWYLTALLSGICVFSFIGRLKPAYRYYAYGIWLAALLICYGWDSPQYYLHCCKSGLYILLGKSAAPVLIMGACLADMCKKKQGPALLIFLIAAAVKFILQACVFAWVFILALAVGLVLAALGRFFLFRSRVLIFLGTISYPVYLLHQNIGYDLMYHLLQRHGTYAAYMSCVALLVGLTGGYLLYLVDKKIQSVFKNWYAFNNGVTNDKTIIGFIP